MTELFALHLDGALLTPQLWRKLYLRYDDGSKMLGWAVPKRVYHSLSHARTARSRLPRAMQPDIRIVRYVPAEEVE